MKKILLILLLLGFTLGEVARIELGSGVAIKLLDIMVGITALFGSVQWIVLYRKEQRPSLVMKAFMLFCGVGILGLLFNVLSLRFDQLMVSSLYLFRFISFIVTAYVIHYLSKQDKEFVFKGLIVSGIGILSLGFLQFFLYSSLRNLYYLGWDEHLHRMFSTFLDPNFAGVFFVLFLLVLLPNVVMKKQLNIYVPLSVITLIAVLLTYSRSTFIMLLVSVSVLLSMMGKKKFILFFFTLLILAVGILSSTYRTHNTDPFRVASSISRIASAENAVTIIMKNPVIGVGFNSYRYAVQRYGLAKKQEVAFNHAEAGTDNSFLFVFATTGVFGLGVYLYILYLLIVSNLSRGDIKNDQISMVFVASLVGVCVASLFTNYLFYTPILFWLGSIYGLRGYR